MPWYENELYLPVVRLGGAALMGMLIGINRDLHGKPLGLRTLALVAMGAATMALLIALFAGSTGQTPVDAASRVIQGILTGIGFLGAGVIMRSDDGREVHGLATAATIWVTAGIGVACGLALWGVATSATALSLLILVIGGPIEKSIHRRANLRPPPVIIEQKDGQRPAAPIQSGVGDHSFQIQPQQG